MSMHNQAIRILIVDDEKTIRQFLKISLVSHGYIISESETGHDALKKSILWHPDVVILDLGLPDLDGIYVIKKIRKKTKIPIIILSVREEIQDKVDALNAGADDYVTKPFHITELLARLHAVMRRLVPLDQDETFHVGGLFINITNHTVILDNKEINLTPTEYAVLKLLVLNAGKIVSHRKILREIWDKSEELDGVMHLLRVTISNLRIKIESDQNRPRYLITEPGIGYRLRSC